MMIDEFLSVFYNKALFGEQMAANMESLLSKLSIGTPDLGAIGGSSSTSKGLAKILAIAGLERHHTNVLYGCYLDHRLALIKLKGHLLIKYKDKATGITKKYLLQLVTGAVTALKENSYKSVDCYHCGGDGLYKDLQCSRCNGIGKTSKKPKEHQLCGIGRSTWYKKENKALRELFAELVSYLLQLDHELRKAIAKNERDN